MSLLNLEILELLSNYLYPSDLLKISETCKVAQQIICNDSKIWRNQCAISQFNVPFLLEFLSKSPAFDSFIKDTPTNWFLYFKQKFLDAECSEDLIDTENPIEKLAIVKSLLHSIQEEHNLEEQLVVESLDELQISNSSKQDEDSKIEKVLKSATCQILDIINEYPQFLPAYHLLAFSSFILNDFVTALKIIRFGRDIICFEDEPIDIFEDLETEILSIINKKETTCEGRLVIYNAKDDNQVLDSKSIMYPRLDNDIERKLREIFVRFDVDKDNHLNFKELSAYIKFTSESVLDIRIYRQFVASYGGKRKRGVSNIDGLNVDGFLMFYLEQSIKEPEETLSDLRKCGF